LERRAQEEAEDDARRRRARGGEAIESCHERWTDVNVAREIVMLLTRDPAIDLAVIAMAVCEHRR
jgi:hypothetical protein